MEPKKLTDEEIVEAQQSLYDLNTYQEMTTLFKMFGDGTRLKILTVLSKQPCSVNDLSEILGMSQSAISHQLSKLRKANLVKFDKKGLNVFYSLLDDHVMTIFRQALDHVLEECNHFHD